MGTSLPSKSFPVARHYEAEIRPSGSLLEHRIPVIANLRVRRQQALAEADFRDR